MTLDIDLILSMDPISYISYRSEDSSIWSWVEYITFVELLKWNYVVYKMTKSYGHVIPYTLANNLYAIIYEFGIEKQH